MPELQNDKIKRESRHAKVDGAGAGVSAWASALKSGEWEKLSSGMQKLFRTRGLGRGLGCRSPRMGQRVYERIIPPDIRWMGEPAIEEYIEGKDFSHIKSVTNCPGEAKYPSSVVLESASKNRSRGSRNMTSAELAAAKSANQASANKIRVETILEGVKKVAAIEAIVAGLENILHWKRGRKSGEQAVMDAGKSTVSAAFIGFVTMAVLQGLVMACPSLGRAFVRVRTPLNVIGVGLILIGAAARLIKATQHDHKNWPTTLAFPNPTSRPMENNVSQIGRDRALALAKALHVHPSFSSLIPTLPTLRKSIGVLGAFTKTKGP